jgi:CelD/BcsL family acetyltransferase involved in cellulose biosynthesis
MIPEPAAEDMEITVLSAKELATPEAERWSSFQLADPSLASAFFRPEFARAVAEVRHDAYVGVLEDEAGVAGFFPFHKQAFRIGKPIGGRLSDYHGVVARAGARWDAEELVRRCGLRAWDFNHLVRSQEPFRRHHVRRAWSPYLDLTDGFDAYTTSRARSGSDVMRQVKRKTARLERELGTVRFVAADLDPAAFAMLRRWKSAQYRQTNKADLFKLAWIVELFERLIHTREPCFSGLLSTLYVEDRLLAAHLGIRSSNAWHWWIPAYDRTASQYSPGLILLVEMARSAHEAGVGIIDLGRGDELYKRRFMSAAFPLVEGSVSVSGALAACRRVGAKVRAAGVRTPFAETAKGVVRSLGLHAEQVRASVGSLGRRP